MYLSKSASKSEKATQLEVELLEKSVLEEQVKCKQLFLKYTQKYLYRPKIITLSMPQHVTIRQAFVHINKRRVFIG